MKYKEIENFIRECGSGCPEHETEVLLGHLCGIDAAKLKLLRAGNAALPAETEESVRAAIKRRAAGEPLQYIIGRWDFRGQTYIVTPDCLIPRPETELLVSLAAELVPHGAVFADLCTGSGCVAISVLAARPDTLAAAADISAAALAVALRNAKLNRVSDRVSFHRADIFDDREMSALPIPPGGFDAVTANPPYIPTPVLSELARELAYEPPAALDGGADGLRFYGRLITDSLKYVRDGGFMLLEIGYDQADEVRAIAGAAGLSCELKRDYSGNDRVVIIEKNYGFV